MFKILNKFMATDLVKIIIWDYLRLPIEREQVIVNYKNVLIELHKRKLNYYILLNNIKKYKLHKELLNYFNRRFINV
jgi:hypothetical protein